MNIVLKYIVNIAAYAALLPLVLTNTASGASPVVPTTSVGTAFAVSADGYMLTALHLVLGKSRVHVGPLPSGKWVYATVEHVDPQLDLALLKAPLSTAALPIASIEEHPSGLDAYVIGFPRPQSGQLDRRITAGLVSGRLTSRGKRNFWIISAAVQRGNSGGPVLAADGSVIGMIQGVMAVKMEPDKTDILDIPQNVNYAVESADIIRFLKKHNIIFEINNLNTNLQSTALQIYRRTMHSIFAVVSGPE